MNSSFSSINGVGGARHNSSLVKVHSRGSLTSYLQEPSDDPSETRINPKKLGIGQVRHRGTKSHNVRLKHSSERGEKETMQSLNVKDNI